MKKIAEINYEKLLLNCLESTINYAKQTGEFEKPEIKKFLEELKSDTNEAVDSIRTSDYFDNRIRELISRGYREEAIILIVTIFEVKMRYFLKKSKGNWFYISHFSEISDEEKIALRKKIQQYLKKIRMFDEYLHNLYSHQYTQPNSDIECLYYTIFQDDRIINFQNLTDDNGVRKAYMTFLDIDISKCLDPDLKKSYQKWDLLITLFKERHNIIHRGIKTELSDDEINSVLLSINSITHTIILKEYNFVKSEHEKMMEHYMIKK